MIGTPYVNLHEHAHPLTRRHFLAASAGILSATTAVTARGRNHSPNQRVSLGFIGHGSRGTQRVQFLLPRDDCQVVAVCDVYQSKADRVRAQVDARYARNTCCGAYRGCVALQDYRDMLARDDIDAVVIASPEHWHALHAASAARAGKDVYCEKTLTLTIAEGQELCHQVRRYGRVLQVGLQQRSMRQFRFASELVRNGYVGQLREVRLNSPGLSPGIGNKNASLMMTPPTT